MWEWEMCLALADEEDTDFVCRSSVFDLREGEGEKEKEREKERKREREGG